MGGSSRLKTDTDTDTNTASNKPTPQQPTTPAFKRNAGRMDSLDIMEGLGLERGHGGGSGEKVLVHKEWTKEPLPDDFDDEDLE